MASFRSIGLPTLSGLLLAAFASAQVTVRVSAPLPSASSNVLDFELGPSGTHALYVADQERAGVHELFRVPLDGSSPPLRLHAPLPASGDVLVSSFPSLRIGGGRVVYRADAVTDELFELFSAPLAGGSPEVRLNRPLSFLGDVEAFEITPDGSEVVYSADPHGDDILELFAVPIDGSAPARPLHERFSRFVLPLDIFTFPRRRSVERFWLLPGGRVVYAVQERVFFGGAGRFTLHSVPLDGSAAPVLLAQEDYPHFSSLSVRSFHSSPDGAWLAYVQELSQQPVQVTKALYLQRTDGSAPRSQLAAWSGCCGDGILSSGFTQDGQRVVWSGGSGSQHLLFSADLAAQVTPIDQPLGELVWAAAMGPGADDVHALSSGGVRRHQADGGGPPVPLGTGSFSRVLLLAPDASRLVFGHDGVYSLASAGGTTLELQAPGAGMLQSLRVLPDSGGMVYDVRIGLQTELRYVPIDGSAAPSVLHPPLPPGGLLLSSANGQPLYRLVGSQAVVFRASLASASSIELWITLL